MGFKYWYEGIIFIMQFLVIVALPCVAVGVWGAKMINELGNFPTKAAKIQWKYGWKVLLVELFSFLLIVAFFVHYDYNTHG